MERLQTFFTQNKNATIIVASTLIASAFMLYKYYQIPRTLKGTHLPQKMRALLLKDYVQQHSSNPEHYASNFEVAELPLPQLRSNELLVKVECSAINPSDLSYLRGTYNSAQRERLPCQLGFEAAGTVVQTGGGFISSLLLGKRVGVCATGGGKFWAEYAVVKVERCIILPSAASFEEGTCCFVNPMTVIAFVRLAKQFKQKAIIHTAASGALGLMLIRYAKQHAIDVICIVRRQSQVDDVIANGASYVVNSSVEGWKGQLTEICKKLNCHMAFDAVGGEITGDILHAMPPKSTVYVYGGLSLEPSRGIRASDLIFTDKKVHGFWLTSTMGSLSILSYFKDYYFPVKNNLLGSLATKIRKTYRLQDVALALADYNQNMSAGKIGFCPHKYIASNDNAAVIAVADNNNAANHQNNNNDHAVVGGDNNNNIVEIIN